MYKQSTSRNQRSKGVKVKHALQICLLLAVCFWLIYQVKHSHDNRKEFDEKVLDKPGEDRLKLGRKDLLPLEDDEEEEKVVSSEKHDEEEDNHGIEEEEEKKHDIEEEVQEQEVDNTKEVKNDDERGDGDDELDELDQVKTEGLVDHEEDLLEEEREGEDKADQTEEEREGEDKADQTENESSLEEEQEEHDDGNDGNTHEAREEHYKADDASSEVAHDDANSIQDYPDSAVYLPKDKSNVTHVINYRNNSNLSLTNDQTAASLAALNLTAEELQGNNTVLFQSYKLSLGAPMQNSSETVLKSIQAQNVKIEEMVKKEREFIENLADPNQTSDANDNTENGGTVQNDKSGSSDETQRTDEEENTLYSDTANETVDDDSVQHEQIDSSDSDFLEEHANRIDLDTLPDIKTEGIDNEDVVAAE